MSDPKDPADDSTEDPVEDAGASAAGEEEAPQPWGAGARPLRKKRTRLWAGLAVLVLFAAGWTAWPALEALLPSGMKAVFEDKPRGPDLAVLALAGRIDRLEAEIARLDSVRLAARSGGDGPALAEIQATVSRLTSRLGALEAKPVPQDSGAPPSDDRIEALTERLDALEQAGAQTDPLAERLNKIEHRVASDTGAAALARVSAENRRLAAALERMSAQIAGIEARRAEIVETLEAQARLGEAQAGLGRDLQTVAGRLERLEAKAARLADADLTRKGDALLLAIGQLREAIAGNRPFSAELDTVLRIVGPESFLAEVTTPLAPLAARGIETQAQLIARFPRLAVKAAQAAIAPEEGGWIGRTVARLARVVTVRRVGEDVSGETAMAALARAEAALAKGDLAAVEAAFHPIAGKPAEVLAEWRAAALARTAAQTAIARLSNETIARLSRAAGAANGAAR